MLFEITVVVLCLAAGGVLKGATGAGAPILAVPALTAFFDVRFAITVMLVSNLTTNAWQSWRFREHFPERRLMIPLMTGGIVGVAIGTLALTKFRSDTLSIFLTVVLVGYIALRLARPHWQLGWEWGVRLALPAGLASGLLQGAAGLSAPVSITFLSALKMRREAFIASISGLFVAFTLVQAASIAWYGLMSGAELFYSVLAVAPVTAAMPIGAALARRLSPQSLDRALLAILAIIAAKLLVDVV